MRYTGQPIYKGTTKRKGVERIGEFLPKYKYGSQGRSKAISSAVAGNKQKGMFSEARAFEPEMRKLKRELGVKPKANKLTPAQLEQRKKQLKERLRKCR